MPYPFPRSWTRRQKRVIVASVVLAIAFCTAGIYGYERYYRGPGQEILFGTWHNGDCIDCTDDLTLYPNHTFVWSGFGVGRYWIDVTGKWYADFNRLLFFPDRRDVDEPAFGVVRLAGVTDNELKITDGKWTMTYARRKTMTRYEIKSMADKVDWFPHP
jgi:hypothetical protein